MPLPPRPIAGADEMGINRLYDAPFDPCFELTVDGAVLATLFHDDKPEVAYASVEVVDEDGNVRLVPGAEAGLDEDEVGWCLQFTDEPRAVDVIARVPASWVDQALGTAWFAIAERVAERGLWLPESDFRLWS